MPGFHRASEAAVNVFRVDETYLFKHYFDGDEVFDRLKHYYNNQHYRFEIPAEDFEEISEFLQEHGYALVEVENIEEFVVVVEKYTEHPDNIFKASVMQRGDADYNVFLMKDQVAVEDAVHNGATRVTDTDLAVPF